MSEVATPDTSAELLGSEPERESNEGASDTPQVWTVAGDDPSIVWKGFVEVLGRTEHPRRRQILETIIEHLRTETAGDLAGVMATVAPDAAFSTPWGPGPQGWEEVRGHYEEVFAAGGIGNARVDTHRIVVDDDAIVNEYTWTLLVPRDLAKENGFDVPEDEGHYAVSQRVCTLLPFDPEGRLRGEISYSRVPDPTAWIRVPDDALSPGYLKWLEGALGR